MNLQELVEENSVDKAAQTNTEHRTGRNHRSRVHLFLRLGGTTSMPYTTAKQIAKGIAVIARFETKSGPNIVCLTCSAVRLSQRVHATAEPFSSRTVKAT
jgi:hypothetical protein